MKPGHNGYDGDRLNQYHDEIMANEDRKASIMSKAMLDCKEITGQNKLLFDEAKEDGIPKMQLKAIVKLTKLERKTEKVRDDMEVEDQDTLDQMMHAMGMLADTPLGQAAAAKAHPDTEATVQ
jgi:uncharacterized protein (UPF0335 family)